MPLTLLLFVWAPFFRESVANSNQTLLFVLLGSRLPLPWRVLSRAAAL